MILCLAARKALAVLLCYISMSVIQQPLVFVDIETNGMSHSRGNVIEIAAIRVENMEVVDTFTSLINPGNPLPQFITQLTGITSDDVMLAPYFGEIADDFTRIMDGAIFVAHNVRFDYSFIKEEYRRLGQDFDPKLLCTVRLSRALFPEHKKHSLKELITRHSLSFESRHRAYDDAHAIYQFYKLVHDQFDQDIILDACKKQLKLQALPSNIDHALIDSLPNGPGVYIFEDELNTPIYIGKSVEIRKRVLSHFTDDHKVSKELKISQHIRNIRAIETTGELEALLLESQMVKELQPLYNIKLRRQKKLTLLVAEPDADGYLRVRIGETEDIDPAKLNDLLGVVTNRGKAKQTLEMTNKLFDLCPKLLGLEKATGSCFYKQLDKCHGACTGDELPESYNRRLLLAFEKMRFSHWPYKGPVLIEEQDLVRNRSAGVIVDQWCIVAQVSQEEASEPQFRSLQKAFDLDTYKILRAFLSTKKHQLTIKLLNTSELSQLTDIPAIS
jgi:DNA polymerase-3 subunit epsilon